MSAIPDRIGKLEALRLRPTTDIGDLLDCEVVISMLPDDDAVREIVFGRKDIGFDGLAAGLMPGAIHLSMSTISTAAASLLASEHARNGQGYVAAPVFGNPDAAKARQLFIVAAGVSADIERCQPILDSLGQRTFVIGANPADANLVKLLGNMMSATALEMLGEVVAVVRKRGLDPQPFIDVMTSTMFGGRAHRMYGEKVASQCYVPGFVLPLVLKDVRLALAEAECAGAPVAFGERGPGPVDHGNRARLRRTRLERPRAYRGGGGGALCRAFGAWGAMTVLAIPDHSAASAFGSSETSGFRRNNQLCSLSR